LAQYVQLLLVCCLHRLLGLLGSHCLGLQLLLVLGLCSQGGRCVLCGGCRLLASKQNPIVISI
jgi:hypothetical protein